MANQPYLPLYTGDWKKDAELSICSPSTRGIWIDLVCSLHDGHTSQVTGTPEQLSRLCRCSVAEMNAALADLTNTKAANVQQRGDIFTVVCRRMKRAEEIRAKKQQAGNKSAANRQHSPEYESEDEGVLRVREFARERGISEKDSDWFFWKCHANGWTNGGKPILDWKGTLRSWQIAGYLPSQKASRNGAPERKFYEKPKERAPSGPAYRPVEFGPELTDEQIAKNKAVIAREKAILMQKFRPH